jgi:hypothetical protein
MGQYADLFEMMNNLIKICYLLCQIFTPHSFGQFYFSTIIFHKLGTVIFNHSNIKCNCNVFSYGLKRLKRIWRYGEYKIGIQLPHTRKNGGLYQKPRSTMDYSDWGSGEGEKGEVECIYLWQCSQISFHLAEGFSQSKIQLTEDKSSNSWILA